MTKKLNLLFCFIMVSVMSFTQTSIYRFSSKISLVPPDKASWVCIKDVLSPDRSNGVLIFKHNAIIDSKGRSVEAAIIINYEVVKDKLDAKQYSVKALYNKPFKPNRQYLGGYPAFSSDRHSAVYKGDYVRDNIKHTVVLGYICFGSIGLEIVGDATEEVFPQLQSEMLQFIKSVKLNE